MIQRAHSPAHVAGAKTFKTLDQRVRLDAVAIKAQLRHRLRDLADSLLGPSNRAMSTRQNLRWGTKGSFSVVVAGAKAGLCGDFEAGESGDAVWLIRHVRRCTFGEALAWAADWLGDAGTSTRAAAQWRQQARQRHKEKASLAADRNRRIRVAQFIAGHAEPVAPGSLADQYLTVTRGIARPPGGWPGAVRFLPAWSNQPDAVAFIATDQDGAVCGVQRVSIDAGAAKINKRSRGAFAETGAVVRLPGPLNGPLLVAEGPETGLSVWAATGFETWVSVGTLSRLALPVGRRVVICRDDDAEGSPGDRAVRRANDGWRVAGINMVVAVPWLERKHDKSDFNDVIRVGGPDAVRRQVEAALCPIPMERRRRVSIEEARKLTAAASAKFYIAVSGGADASLCYGARIDVGVGKSAATRDQTARFLAAERANHAAGLLGDLRTKGDRRTVVVAVPDHALGTEAIEAFHAHPLVRGHRLVAAQWRGRTAADPERPGEAMCLDIDRVRAAQAVGADVEKACCGKELDDGTVVECPFFRECGYQRQKRQGDADVFYIAHETLFTGKPAIIGEPAAVIIDESFWQAGLEGTDGGLMLTVDTLAVAPSLTGTDGQRQRYLRNVLLDALIAHADGPLGRQELLDAGLNEDMAHEAHALEWRMHKPPELDPGMSADEFKTAEQQSEPHRTARRLARLFRIVASLLAPDGPDFSGWAERDVIHPHEGDVRIVRMRGRRAIKEGWKAPTLLIDANLNIDHVRTFFPTVEMIADVAVFSPHQKIVQIDGRSNSKRSLFNDDRAELHRQKLAGTVRKILRNHLGKALVVGQLRTKQWLKEHGNLPAPVELAHFNAVAGRDIWGDVSCEIIVGRAMPSSKDVEQIAMALSGKAVDRLDGAYPRVQVGREMAGGWATTAEAPRHPNPLCESIRAHICEGELIQAIGRARGVNRSDKNPITIYVLTDLPVPVPVDHLVLATALDPSPADQMMDHGGIAFLSASHAAKAYPKLWRTVSGAKSALSRAEKSDANSHEFIKWGSAPHFQRVEYQLAGQGQRPAEAIVNLADVPNPQALIEETLGALVMFRIVDQEEAPVAPVLRKPADISDYPGHGRAFWLDSISLPPAPPVYAPPPWVGIRDLDRRPHAGWS